MPQIYLTSALLLVCALLLAWTFYRTRGGKADVMAAFEEEAAALQTLMQKDDLTNCRSRLFVRGLVEREDQNGQNALALIDLDNFKTVNDGFGHKAGDTLLCHVADVMLSMSRFDEEIFRISADRFGIYMRNVSLDAAVRRGEAFRAALVDATISVGDMNVGRVASVGVAVIAEDQDFAGAIYYAEEALVAAKKGGGNQATPTAGETLRTMIERRTGPRAEDLASALERGEITYYLQPIFQLSSQKITGFEALLRWERADGSVVGPQQFLDVIARNHHMFLRPLAELINRVAKQVQAVSPTVTCAFNLSSDVLDMDEARAVALIDRLLDGVDPEMFVFEIVESATLPHSAAVQRVMHDLRSRGVRIALDDFGTGQSNFERLQMLDVDIVKIDQQFVQTPREGSHDASIVAALVDVADKLGLEVIAEGVETPDEMETLMALGIEQAQGFLLGEPLPVQIWLDHLSEEGSHALALQPA